MRVRPPLAKLFRRAMREADDEESRPLEVEGLRLRESKAVVA